MIYDYVVTLRNNNRRYIDNVSVLLCFVSLVFLTLDQLKHGVTVLKGFLSLAVLILLVWNLYLAFNTNRIIFYSRVLLLAGVGWLTMPVMFWVGFPLIALGLLEKLAKSPLEIGFSSDEIVFNSLIKRRFTWPELNNVVLKDDLLTMDFKNNKLLQRLTLDEDTDADEKEFNAYCRQKLSGTI